jgi:hypothetical protein
LLGASNPACNKLSAADRKQGAESTRLKAVAFYANVLPTIADLRESGHTLQAIADQLNGDGYATQRGLPFTPKAIQRLCDRID